MTDPRDYKIDIAGTDRPATPAAAPNRKFLQVRFACCNVYQRIYQSADGGSYQGRCPKCGKPVKFVPGDGGTDSREFVIY